MGKADSELSLLITADAEIAEINQAYLNRPGPTNVIAFPMQNGDFPEIQPDLLGDVVISLETADREAGDAGIPFGDRFTELLVHGILHLLGYDHEIDEADAKQMFDKTDELMAQLREKKICMNFLSE